MKCIDFYTEYQAHSYDFNFLAHILELSLKENWSNTMLRSHLTKMHYFSVVKMTRNKRTGVGNSRTVTFRLEDGFAKVTCKCFNADSTPCYSCNVLI